MGLTWMGLEKFPSIFGRFCSFLTVFGQFWPKTAKIDSKSAPLEGCCGWVLGGAGGGGSVAGSQVTILGGQTTATHWKNGEFHSDPVCTDPVQNRVCGPAAIDNLRRAKSCQSPIAGIKRTRSTLASHSAIPHTLECILHHRTPIARFESQHNPRRGSMSPT